MLMYYKRRSRTKGAYLGTLSAICDTKGSQVLRIVGNLANLDYFSDLGPKGCALGDPKFPYVTLGVPKCLGSCCNLANLDSF
jgi:hypothetical protein